MTENRWTRRDFLRRSAVAGGAAIGAPALLSACGGGSTGGGGGGGGGQNLLAQLKQQGSVTVGIANEAPYGFLNEQGEVTGEAPAVAKAVFDSLGIPDMQAEVVGFDSLIPGLNANKYAMVAAGMYITPKRCDAAAFSIPDYCAPTAFLVPEDNPKNVTRFTDIAQGDATLGVLGGAVEKRYAEEKGVPSSRLKTFEGQNDLYEAVAVGRVYCGALTNISLNYLVEKRTQANLEVTEPFSPVINGDKQTQCGGFVFRPENDQLRKAFNRELKSLQQSGKWVDIVSQFIGFSKANLPPDDVTTRELCTEQGASPTATG